MEPEVPRDLETMIIRRSRVGGGAARVPTRGGTGQPGTILVVDDDASVRGFLRKVLERHGYICDEAPNAREAREGLQRRSYDLMLCDVQMPGESGLELARHVMTAHPDVGVVMVTVVHEMETARDILALDVYGYLVKPVDGSQILISVANAMRRRELELARKDVLVNLEKAVEQRTRELRRANRRLKRSEDQLRVKATELEELNSALKVVLQRVEADRQAIEERIRANVEIKIGPFLDRLKTSRLSGSQRNHLELLEAGLGEIASPFVAGLSSACRSLTPQEIQVADLVKRGKSTKEIAAVLGLSVNTVMSHRYRIRTKLGLKRSRQNLCSFLATLPNQ